jgi:hypothetical protein
VRHPEGAAGLASRRVRGWRGVQARVERVGWDGRWREAGWWGGVGVRAGVGSHPILMPSITDFVFVIEDVSALDDGSVLRVLGPQI